MATVEGFEKTENEENNSITSFEEIERRRTLRRRASEIERNLLNF